jgi:16S rRNA (cytidine1402-2'-O)-methyltransferase
MPGTLFVVATPIGNLEDISARALRVLREVALIAAEDTRRTAHLLARYAITTPTTSVHEHNEVRKSAGLVERLRQGEDIALVSDAGTPTISDPGRHLVRATLDAGCRVEAIPGPSAVMTALAASGLPADTFTFLGFPPTRLTDRNNWFESLRTAGRTVVFFEAPHRVRETLEQLQLLVGDVPISVARELTKAHEELVNAPISSVISGLSEPKGEFVVVVPLGQLTISLPIGPPSDNAVADQFGDLTKNVGMTRREAVKALAKRHRIPSGVIYAAIERSKTVGK